MNDIVNKIELLQKEIEAVKKDIIILKGSSNLLFINNEIHRPTPREIAKCVCEVTGVPYAQIHSKRQTRRVVIPRQIISCIARWEYYYTTIAIAKYFKHGHATVLYSTKTMNNLIQTDESIAKLYDQCLVLVKSLNK